MILPQRRQDAKEKAGVMEYWSIWSAGVLETFHYSITPLLHYSNQISFASLCLCGKNTELILHGKSII